MKTLIKVSALFSTILCSLLIFSSLSIAQDLPQRGPIPFATYDVNSDGFVSQEEFYNLRAKRIQQKVDQGMPMRNVGNSPDFELFDTNGDGKLTELELIKGQNAMMQNRKQNKGNKSKGFGGKGMMQQQ
ncbi:EF-hand domain-containing protein [Halarcobacter sp.]|uniref:EF-hand domain-containing protein n=1 Tax=Halarcobacter sp. TaxID=2321133 RepID=UPI002AA92730|nr:EF-hand domain-containing protein [Halarcobacter sp.]